MTNPTLFSSVNCLLGVIDKEAVAVAIVCVIFLLLFIVAGVRDILKRKEDE